MMRRLYAPWEEPGSLCCTHVQFICSHTHLHTASGLISDVDDLIYCKQTLKAAGSRSPSNQSEQP